MATFLDVTTLQNFSIIFVFLFVYLFIYAFMIYTKLFGGNQFVNLLIPFVVAFFVVISPTATKVITSIAPVFVIIIIFVLIVSIVTTSMFGQSWTPESLQGVKWIILVVLVISLLVGTLATLRDSIDVPETGEDYSETSTVFFHPNFIGLILFFLVAVFTVGLLASRSM